MLGIRSGVLFFTSIIVAAVSMLLTFGETVAGEDGRFIVDNDVAFGWFTAILTWASVIICRVGTHNYIAIAATRIEAHGTPSSEGLAECNGRGSHPVVLTYHGPYTNIWYLLVSQWWPYA